MPTAGNRLDTFLVIAVAVLLSGTVAGVEPAWSEASAETLTLGPAARSVYDIAAAELQRLDSFEGTGRSAARMMERNLTRYFVLDLMPSQPDEIGRVLGTAERMSRQAAAEIYRAAVTLARAEGSDTVQEHHLAPILARILPKESNEFGEVAFFPAAQAPVIVEHIDLEAFLDTGFTWKVLIYLAQHEIEPDPGNLPVEPQAVALLGGSVNAYALLLLRIGGMHARMEFAPYLQSRHLRAAGKTIGQQGSDLDSITREPMGSRTAHTWFTEVSEQAGVRFRHVSSDWLARFRRYGPIAPTFSGGGVSAGYLDDDRWVDLVTCGGQGCAVFRNLGDGHFEDVTATSGLAVAGEARMATLADFDNDGRTDVFITYARDTNRLFHNEGNGVFRDITAGSGLEQQGDISGPAVAFDYDNDGRLDIYVGNFGNYVDGEAPWSPNASINGMPNRLYHNNGGLRFTDVTAAAGVGNTGWTQALSHLDYDRDGDQDLYIANDFGPNELLVNNGDGTFGTAATTTGSDDPFHGMNVAFADLNHDLYADIFVTNIWTWNPTREAVIETNSLLLSSIDNGGEISYRRLEDPEFLQYDTGWSWGAVFFDADNDADDDLFIVNGFTDYLAFVQYRRSPTDPDELYAINNGNEPNWFFRNDHGYPIVHVADSGLELDGLNSRGVASLDFDRDGDLDLLVSTFHSTTRLFRNDGAPADQHWLSLELVGEPRSGSNRDAIGAEIVVRGDDDLYVWRRRSGGEGYLSVNSPDVMLGVGSRTQIEIEVTWPNGERQVVTDAPVDRRIRLIQGREGVELLPGP